MIFKYTLYNRTEGLATLSDPIGWDSIKIKLQRSDKYHSLAEMIDVPLMFYGTDYDYIKNIETTQGINATIEINIRISEDGGTTYEDFFNGILDLSTIKDISDAEFYKLECSVLRNDFWSKFTNRTSIPVDLEDTVDLDGNSITQINHFRLPLPSQRMRENDQHELDTSGKALTFSGANIYLQMDWDVTVLSEIERKLNYFITVYGSSEPFELYQIKREGDYTFDIQIHSYIDIAGTPSAAGSVIEYYLNVNGTEDTFTTSSEVYGAYTITKSVYSGVKNLNVGDQVKIYGKSKTGNVGNAMTVVGYNEESTFTGIPSPATYLNIEANTVYPSSETDAILIKDAADSITQKIIGQDSALYSDYLDTCAGQFVIMRGLHVRGYTFAEKSFSLSFDDWWDGIDPILNLGLGYETISGTEYIRIEDKASFYSTSRSLDLDYVSGITRSYDREKIVKSIEVGYAKWSAESASGVDDPQAKLVFSTIFEQIGADFKALSKFIAASLAIEQTRRNRKEQGKDWRLDEDVLIIHVTDTSPIIPVLDEEFDSVTNLLNSSTRYNIVLSAKRNLLRLANIFLGGLQSYTTSSLKFVRGEGNYDMSSDYNCGSGCTDLGIICDDIGEGTDLNLTNYAAGIGYLHTPQVYEFTHDLSWTEYKTIRDNRKKAIGVSESNEGHVTLFINTLEYDPFEAKVTITGWLR